MKTHFWNNPRYRQLFVQCIVIVIIITLAYNLFHNVQTNLAKQGIASGFDFLDDTAGFDIIMHLLDYNAASSYGRAFLVGLGNTLLISLLGIVFSTILGVMIGIGRLSSNWLVEKLSLLVIETFRNIPLLLQIFFWYFAVLRALPTPRHSLVLADTIIFNNRGIYLPAPSLTVSGWWLVGFVVVCVALGIALHAWAHKKQINTGRQIHGFWIACVLFLLVGAGFLALLGNPLAWHYPKLHGFNYRGGLVLIPEFNALLLALTVYTATFIAEIVRAGILSVSHGQIEAASALGLKSGLILRLIIFPQALRVIIPPLTNQYLNLTKNSSLAAAIAYPDLVSVFAGTVLNQTGQAIEVIGITMAVYLVISLSISIMMNQYQKRKTHWSEDRA